MEGIKIEGTELEKIIQESLPKILRASFESSYDSPIRRIVDNEIKLQEGVFRVYIRSVLTSIFTDEKFRQKIADEVIAAIIQKGLK